MPQQVTCPSCGTTLKAPDAVAGKTCPCPKCKARVPVPDFEALPELMPDDAPALRAVKREDEGPVSGRPRRRRSREEEPDNTLSPKQLAVYGLVGGGLVVLFLVCLGIVGIYTHYALKAADRLYAAGKLP